jgi:hypothetical protein
MLTDTKPKNKKVGTYGIRLATLRSQLPHFVGNGINILYWWQNFQSLYFRNYGQLDEKAK